MGINTTQFFAAYEGDWEDFIAILVVARSLPERGQSLPESAETIYYWESLLKVQENTSNNYHPMEHIPGFNRSHWMPPLGKCSHCNCIAAVAAMVNDFGRKHKTLQKTI
jgi:hypothetical protein